MSLVARPSFVTRLLVGSLGSELSIGVMALLLEPWER